MKNCAIVGINWGDEGKGRMVDLLTEDYDVVIRYQGGGNAGHTVVNDYGKFALHLLPSGSFHPGVVNILGNGVALDAENLWKEIEQVREKYPNARAYAITLRQVVSANEHLWGAILWADGQWFVEEPRPIQVMDRIGGGDGFSGGLLYAVLQGWDAEKWLQFGWASGVLAASSLNDYAEPADEKQVWDVYKGNARVQR